VPDPTAETGEADATDTDPGETDNAATSVADLDSAPDSTEEPQEVREPQVEPEVAALDDPNEAETDAADIEPAAGPMDDAVTVAAIQTTLDSEPTEPRDLVHTDEAPQAGASDPDCPLPDTGVAAPGDPACEAAADAAVLDVLQTTTETVAAVANDLTMSEPRQIAGVATTDAAGVEAPVVSGVPSAEAHGPSAADAEIAVARLNPEIEAPAATGAEATPAQALPAPEMRDQAVTNAGDAIAPTFDIVRVAPGGSAVIAGRAEPGAAVSVLDHETVVGSAVADARGEWVVVSDQPLPAGPSEIGLVARSADGAEAQSEQVVVLMVPDAPLATVGADAPAEQPVAVLMARAGGGDTKLLQGGVPGGGLTAPEQLRLESVSYDDAGDFDISGTAIPGNMIAAYLDNQPIGSTPVDTEGQWRLLPDKVIDPGLYTLRIDQVDKSGLVISRLETPFSIADLTNTAIAEGLVVVQPGNSLWRIARRIYGKGVEHTVIYQANSDQIRDPDLIYPGQIFIVPGESSDG
jgi:nucleoid-associated protein YgaU